MNNKNNDLNLKIKNLEDNEKNNNNIINDLKEKIKNFYKTIEEIINDNKIEDDKKRRN